MLRVLLVLTCCAWSAVPNSLADVTGRWRVTISSGDDAIAGVAVQHPRHTEKGDESPPRG